MGGIGDLFAGLRAEIAAERIENNDRRKGGDMSRQCLGCGGEDKDVLMLWDDEWKMGVPWHRDCLLASLKAQIADMEIDLKTMRERVAKLETKEHPDD